MKENGAKVIPSEVIVNPLRTTRPSASSTRQGTLASKAAASPVTSRGDLAVGALTRGVQGHQGTDAERVARGRWARSRLTTPHSSPAGLPSISRRTEASLSTLSVTVYTSCWIIRAAPADPMFADRASSERFTVITARGPGHAETVVSGFHGLK